MKVAIFDAHDFEKDYFIKANQQFNHEVDFFDSKLTEHTAILAKNYSCVCIFVNDSLNQAALEILYQGGTRLIALRCAGYNQIDLKAAKSLGLKVVYVPEYSPYAVAEHALALIQTLNRKTHRAYARVREGNFSLNGMVGFDLHGKNVGIIGTGRIGKVLARIMTGFGCTVYAYDVKPDYDLIDRDVCTYLSLEKLLQESDIISLHIPLNANTKYLINKTRIALMKRGVMLINTGRGGLIDTKALIEGLKNGHIGYAGLDVYELEKEFFFQDLSERVLNDDLLARLISFPNVLLTGHQGFLTKDALVQIAETTLTSIFEFEKNKELTHEIRG